MKFIVLGASGFVGKHFYAKVKEAGYDCIGTRNRSDDERFFPFALGQDRIADSLPEVNSLKNNTYAVICIKYGLMDVYDNQSGDVEVKAMKCLIKDLLDLGTKVVYLSTSYVFDGQTGNYSEISERMPISTYGSHKYEIEKYIEKLNGDILTLRLDKVVGDKPTESHLFSEWWSLVKQSKNIECIETQFMSPTFVEDITKGILEACQLGLTGIYNHANPHSFRRSDLAQLFVNKMGVNTRVVERSQENFKFTELRPLRSNLDSSRFQKETGLTYTPMVDVISKFKKEVLILSKW